jgi:tetratricopeptide (TPR) repeat protein
MIAAIQLVAATAIVLASETPQQLEDAKKYFDAGRQAYEAGDYQAAAAAFEESYALSPRPAIVFSIAQAYRQQYFVDRDASKLRRAIGLYTEYLKEVPKGGRRNDAIRNRADLEETLARAEKAAPSGHGPKPADALPESKTQLMVSSRTPGALASIDGGEAQEAPLIEEVKAGTHSIKVSAEGYVTSDVGGVAVEHRLVVVEVNLRPRPAFVTLSAPDGSEVQLDGRPIGFAPLMRPIQMPSGEHFLAVTDRGKHAFVRQLNLQKGEELSVVASLDSTVQRDISYLFLGAGAVVFAGTGVALIVALTSEGQARLLQQKLTKGMNLTPDERDLYNMYRNRRNDLVTASSIGIAGSVALGVIGGLLYFLDVPVVPSGAASGGGEPAVQPLVGAGTVGAQVTGRF